jgi:excisionase family DNA binding protein
MPQAALTSLNEPVPDAPNTALLDTATVAELLACSPRTVTSLIVRGILPAVRLGPGRSAYRIRPAALLEFVSHYGHHEPGDVADRPGDVADFVPTPALLVETRTPEGLRLVTPCWSPDTPQGG